MFNANSQMEFESRDEKNSSYCESMIKCATLAFRFIFLSSMRTRKERATKGKKIITIKLNSRMGQKNSFCCELMIKWRRYVCNVRDAHFYASIFLFLSLSLSLSVCLCTRFLVAFRTSVRWWKRGLYCALCSLLKYSRDDCSRRKRNFWLKNGIASRETPLSSVPLNNEQQTSVSRWIC